MGGRVYVMFDGNKREVYLISTRLAGYRVTKKFVSAYSQFRGIAAHHKTNEMLLLCKREESLLLGKIGEVLPKYKESLQDVLEEISMYWFTVQEESAFFGVT